MYVKVLLISSLLCLALTVVSAADANCEVDLFFQTVSGDGDLCSGDAVCTLTLTYNITACEADGCTHYDYSCEGNVIKVWSTECSGRGSCTVSWK